MSAYAGYLIETFVTLVGVCALAALVLWAARRAGIAKSTGPIELRGYLPLDGRRAIALVKVGATVFVVGVGEGGFTKLGEVPDDALPATQPRRGPTFAHVLARVLGDQRVDVRAAVEGSAPRGAVEGSAPRAAVEGSAPRGSAVEGSARRGAVLGEDDA